MNAGKFLMAVILFLLIPVSAFSEQCSMGEASAAGKNKTFTAGKETTISVADLKNKYHWNGKELLWKWAETLSGIEMANGSVMILSPNTVDPQYGIPFEMGFGGKGFGELCIGNLQLEGGITFAKSGLVLHKGTKLTYLEN